MGAVLFDDEHQGLGVEYDPAKFYRDPRLYATLGVVLAVWLAWVLGSTRLRLPRARAQRAARGGPGAHHGCIPRARAAAGGGGAAHVRALLPAAARAQASAQRRPAAPPWEWLEQHPRLARADVRQLREWYADAYSDRRVPLTRLHNLIVRTERQLAA